jgi:uncharacterized spore protein YtfJ
LEETMTSPAPFAPIAELLERNVSIRHVYGEPVHNGDKTIIPVAKVAYGFGAGGGQGPGHSHRRGEPAASTPGEEGRPEAQGAGGGGGVRMTPVGALEISPAGTRFIPFHPLAPWLGGAAFGFFVGLLMLVRRR